jgi:hypothetical protein
MNSYTLIPVLMILDYFTFVICPEKPGSFPLSIFEELNFKYRISFVGFVGCKSGRFSSEKYLDEVL